MRCGAVYHVQSTNVSTTGERKAIFLLYVGDCYGDIGCVAVHKRGMRCGAVYHVQSTNVSTTGEPAHGYLLVVYGSLLWGHWLCNCV